MLRLLDLVEQGDRIILVGDVALAVRGGQQFVLAQPECAGPLAGSEEDGGAEEGPVERLLLLDPRERLARRLGLDLDEVRKALGVDQLQARRHVERGRAADDQQPLGVLQRVEQSLDVQILEFDREHDRIGALDRAGDAGLVGEIGLDGSAVADFVATAGDRDHLVAAALGFRDDALADIAGRADHCDLHGLSPGRRSFASFRRAPAWLTLRQLPSA